MNFLVETKHEYTTQLINILTPLIYEGLVSIYNDAFAISTQDNIFRNFQSFMKQIPKWNNELITRETTRILNNSRSYTWLEDLIKATLKANIIVLTYNPSLKNQIKIDSNFYQNIKIEDFIHKIYIECARELWSNPYLFYHNYPPIELKRNQRDTILLIKDCIKEAIRKLLPVKHILEIYLGEEMETGDPDDKFENSISEIEQKNLSKLIKKDLGLDNKKDLGFDNIKELGFDNKKDLGLDNKKELGLDNKKELGLDNKKELGLDNKKELGLDNKKELNTFIPQILNNTSLSENKLHNTDNHTVGSKILNIINNKDLNFSDNKTSSNDLNISFKNSPKTSSSKNNNDRNKYLKTTSPNNNLKLNNILKNDLGDSETSIELNNKNFHEMFSNSVMEDDLPNNNIINKAKAQFFSSYLNIN